MRSNLEKLLDQADNIDRHEGMLAYPRYHQVMRKLATHYGFPFNQVVAAFVSLSPNNDYWGNLRSTVTLLHGISEGWPLAQINCSTYRHCLGRAYQYAMGHKDFEKETKGPKITNFYRNILDPDDTRWVTVDGHMVGAWRGVKQTMKELIPKRREYADIKHAVQLIAFDRYLPPSAVQAILWFARKRLLNIKYDAQLDWLSQGDAWKTNREPAEIPPFPRLWARPLTSPPEFVLQPSLFQLG